MLAGTIEDVVGGPGWTFVTVVRTLTVWMVAGGGGCATLVTVTNWLIVVWGAGEGATVVTKGFAADIPGGLEELGGADEAPFMLKLAQAIRVRFEVCTTRLRLPTKAGVPGMVEMNLSM